MTRELSLMVLLLCLASLAGCGNGPSCNTVSGGSGTPSLVFTHVPGLGTTDSLKGQEMHVAPAQYFVAVYIHVDGGWWTKPTFADPDTEINCDGTWQADITTGGNDTQADAITAFLLPGGFAAPPLSGDSSLPQTLYTNA